MNAVERLRRIWTPGRDVKEMFGDLNPSTELDSMLRHFLHATIQQRGPVTLDLDQLNTGMLRWEIVHHQPAAGVTGGQQVSIWIEPEGS